MLLPSSDEGLGERDVSRTVRPVSDALSVPLWSGVANGLPKNEEPGVRLASDLARAWFEDAAEELAAAEAAAAAATASVADKCGCVWCRCCCCELEAPVLGEDALVAGDSREKRWR